MMRFILIICSLVPFFPVSAEPLELRIGATLPLTGRLAYVGEDIRRGITMGIEDFSNKTIKFTVIYEDNQHSGALAATTAQKLLEQDHVDLIISLWDMADVVAPIAERKKVPHIAIRWDPDITKRYSLTITMESTFRSYVESQAHLLKLLKVKKIGLLTEEAKGWILANQYLTQIAANEGLEVVGEVRFKADDRDLGSGILRLVSKEPDAVVIASNPPITELFIQRLREIAPRQFFTGYFEVLANPQLVEGIPFVAQFQVASWYDQRFRSRYGEAFRSRAPLAYDILKLLSLLPLSLPTKNRREAIIEALQHVKDIEGASGELNVNGNRNIESRCVWKVAKDGVFVALTPNSLLSPPKPSQPPPLQDAMH